MIFKFFGGAQEVGRSAILLKDEKSIMMDFGIKIDNENKYPIEIPKIDALVLSHSHLDHSGYVPALYFNQHVPTFGTKPTLELSGLLLDDAINVMKKKHIKPAYYKKQVNSFKNDFVQMEYHDELNFANFNIKLYDAGHISGSSITSIERKEATKNKRVVYTGDFKLSQQTLHKGAEIVESDVLITESTYYSKEHPNREDLIKKFIKDINETLENGGTALLPAFAVGRSQELISIIYENNLAENLFIDGMSKAATKIVLSNQRFIRNSDILSNAMQEATWIEDINARKEATNGPNIILTTAGMLNGGPVLNYIKRLNSKSKIFITGYQVEGTNGYTLINNGYIISDNRKTKITTPFEVYDFSAHSGNADLYRYIKESSPEIVICVHGDKENTIQFAEQLKEEGYEAYAPKVGDIIKLD